MCKPKQEYEVVEVAIDDSVSPPVACAYIRVTAEQPSPFEVSLRCRRNSSVWQISQPWRGGLPHPDPEAQRCTLIHEHGEPDLRPGDVIVVVKRGDCPKDT